LSGQYSGSLKIAEGIKPSSIRFYHWQKEAIGLLTEKDRVEQHRDYQARLRLYQSGRLYNKGLSEGELIARWEFDEVEDGNVIDLSGNGLNGKLIGDAKIISDPQRGKVLSLDGDGDYVDCGDDPAFDIVGSITISAWIRVNKFDRDYQAIITKPRHWRLQRHHQSGTTAFTVIHPETRGGRYLDEVYGNVDVDDRKWHHIAGVYDGTKSYLYVDGKLDNSRDTELLISVGEHRVVLIGELGEERTTRCWNGLIDDVRIYDSALSEAEIKALYEGKELPRKKRLE